MSTLTVNDPKGEAGSKKAPMWLLPPVALEQTAWVHQLGNKKYGPFNWRRTGVCATTYVSAIMRHLNAWRDGEDLDPESGISHIAHIATSCNILLDAAACGTLQDDRNKRPGAGMSAERAEAFRKLIESDPVALRADLQSRTPPTDDHETSGRIEIDDKSVELPPLPEGFARWEDRGYGWDSGLQRVPCFACVWRASPDPGSSWSIYCDDTANGVDSSRYIEAIKDGHYATAAPLPREALFGDIKPGDKVEGWLVHGENFTGRVANVVDIRGTRLFQFLDRPTLTEDEIYSITRA